MSQLTKSLQDMLLTGLIVLVQERKTGTYDFIGIGKNAAGGWSEGGFAGRWEEKDAALGMGWLMITTNQVPITMADFLSIDPSLEEVYRYHIAPHEWSGLDDEAWVEKCTHVMFFNAKDNSYLATKAKEEG